jgi:protein-disulfide isomerase
METKAMAMLRIPVGSTDHIRGNIGAPVTLVEYGDYECIHCGAAHPVVTMLLAQFADDVRFVFRHFPLSEIHPQAEPAAETAEFAGASGRFWQAHDSLFRNQVLLGPALLLNIIGGLGLSKELLREALDSRRFADKVGQDFLGGLRSGVNGTPTFFINGVRHDGSFDLRSLAAAIDAAEKRTAHKARVAAPAAVVKR